ncbi:cystine/glutamine-binding periplasmic protein [Legionella lansingensis]|uniref:Cystine/glutamine-binding periplasmic protein n=1 Tax=Legionella lansingensis TaxID=45067 RepID=A0A0W0VPX4_9GAMM|nr:ABC transporter substrate-binding protein [Legionella lansingensis]KTD22099.1 cystine/glutamine-binding periplasmic protein [Legionella lansingensis]SNV45807.1 cystine/glutamine-binding periplasmic protein [Legionella lansingensis]
MKLKCLYRYIIYPFIILFSYYEIGYTATLQTLQPDQLTVGTYFTNPPLEFLQKNKQVGFEIDLMNEISKRLHLKPIYVNTSWEVIIQQLENNKYDVIMGGITITPAREKIVPYTIPYMTTTLSILINIKKTPNIKFMNDLQNQTIGVQSKTTDYDIALQMQKSGKIKEIKIYPFADFNEAIQDLITGKVGAVMKVFPVANYYTQLHPEIRILTAVPNHPQPLGFGVNPRNKLLLQVLNKTLEEIKADGTYNKFYEKWFTQ